MSLEGEQQTNAGPFSTTEVDSEGTVTIRYFDAARVAAGKVTVVQDPETGGSITTIESKDGSTVTVTKNADGRLTQVTTVDVDGAMASNFFDPQTGAPAGEMSSEMSDDGTRVTLTKPNGETLTVEKDQSGELLAITSKDMSGDVATNFFSPGGTPAGTMLTDLIPGGGSKTTIIAANGSSITLDKYDNGQPASIAIRDGDGNVTQNVFDTKGELIERDFIEQTGTGTVATSVGADGASFSYVRDADGNLLASASSDGRGNTTSEAYNGRGQLIQSEVTQRFDDGSTLTVLKTFDGSGNVQTQESSSTPASDEGAPSSEAQLQLITDLLPSALDRTISASDIQLASLTTADVVVGFASGGVQDAHLSATGPDGSTLSAAVTADGSYNDSWRDADGSYGSDAYGADGSSSGDWHAADGYWTSYAYNADGSGNAEWHWPNGSWHTEIDYANGSSEFHAHIVGDLYPVLNIDTYTAADGSSSETWNAYTADNAWMLTEEWTRYPGGVLHTQTWSAADGEVGSFEFDASGNLAADTWQHADGTYGSDAYYPDGSSYSESHNADGSYSTFTDDGQGDTQANSYAADGTLISDGWQLADGQYGSDLYNADGTSHSESHEVDGSSYADDRMTSSDGSYADAWSSYASDGTVARHGSSSYEASTGETRSVSYNGDGSGYTDDRVMSPNGLYTDAWASYASDGTVVSHGSSSYDASSAETRSISYNGDGSSNSDDRIAFPDSSYTDAWSNDASDGTMLRHGSSSYDASTGETRSVSYSRDGGSHSDDQTVFSDGSYTDAWSDNASDGTVLSHGDSSYDASTGETRSASYNRDGSGYLDDKVNLAGLWSDAWTRIAGDGTVLSHGTSSYDATTGETRSTSYNSDGSLSTDDRLTSADGSYNDDSSYYASDGTVLTHLTSSYDASTGETRSASYNSDGSSSTDDQVASADGSWRDSWAVYASDGAVMSYGTATNDGIRAESASTIYNSDGSSTADDRVTFADSSFTDTWSSTAADGSPNNRGFQTFDAPAGTVHSIAYHADGSYETYDANVYQGEWVRNFYSSGGTLSNDEWQHADGTSGFDDFQSAGGSGGDAGDGGLAGAGGGSADDGTAVQNSVV